MVGIKFSSIQFHFSLYRRLVIELIDSSCQHPLSSSEQFYRDGWQASQFCMALKCTVSFFYRLYINIKSHTYDQGVAKQRCEKSDMSRTNIWAWHSFSSCVCEKVDAEQLPQNLSFHAI